MQASYDENSSEELMYYLAPYVAALGLRPNAIAQIAVCPGYLHCAPGLNGLSDMEGRICYLLNPGSKEPYRPPRFLHLVTRTRSNPSQVLSTQPIRQPRGNLCNTDVDKINVKDPT